VAPCGGRGVVLVARAAQGLLDALQRVEQALRSALLCLERLQLRNGPLRGLEQPDLRLERGRARSRLRAFGQQRAAPPLRRLRLRELLRRVRDLLLQLLEPARLLSARIVRIDPARGQRAVRLLEPLARALHVAVPAGGEAEQVVARPG